MGLDPSKFAIWRDRGVAKMDFWLAGNTEERISPHPGFGYFDRFGNGKVNNSIPVKPFGLKMKTFYIRGCCGGAWMGLTPSNFAILRDRGIAKTPDQPPQRPDII